MLIVGIFFEISEKLVAIICTGVFCCVLSTISWVIFSSGVSSPRPSKVQGAGQQEKRQVVGDNADTQYTRHTYTHTPHTKYPQRFLFYSGGAPQGILLVVCFYFTRRSKATRSSFFLSILFFILARCSSFLSSFSCVCVCECVCVYALCVGVRHSACVSKCVVESVRLHSQSTVSFVYTSMYSFLGVFFAHGLLTLRLLLLLPLFSR